jgi:hypothetical protein
LQQQICYSSSSSSSSEECFAAAAVTNLGVSQFVYFLANHFHSPSFTSLQLDAIEEKAAEEELAPVRAAQARALSKMDRRSKGTKGGEEDEEDEDAVTETLDEEMESAGKAATDELQRKQREMLGNIDMMQYAVGGTDKEWDAGSWSNVPSNVDTLLS